MVNNAPGSEVGTGLVAGKDGTYRWVHELNLWKDPSVLTLTAAVMLLGGLFPALLVGVLALSEGEGVVAALTVTLQVGGLVGAILGVLLLIAYPLYALMQGGKYCVVFEMDERGVTHSQLQMQFRRNQALAMITVLAGLVGRSPQTAGAGLLAASRQSLHTSFSKVRRIKINERRRVIHLAESFSRNQVYAAPEDFAFVRDFIVSHCPKAVVSGQGK